MDSKAGVVGSASDDFRDWKSAQLDFDGDRSSSNSGVNVGADGAEGSFQFQVGNLGVLEQTFKYLAFAWGWDYFKMESASAQLAEVPAGENPRTDGRDADGRSRFFHNSLAFASACGKED
jgi:hypothetical protein